MTPDDLERRLAELGEAYGDLDVGTVLDRSRERLVRMDDDLDDRQRIDRLATRIMPATDAPGEPPVHDIAALLADVDVIVRVLGEVEVEQVEPRHRQFDLADLPEGRLALRLVTYIALRGTPVEREELLANVIGGDGDVALRLLAIALVSAQALVGFNWLHHHGGSYDLHERVTTDYDLFCDLVAQADTTDDVDMSAHLLQQALGLVRGVPFASADEWYGRDDLDREMIMAQVVDAADDLRQIARAKGDRWRSRWALRRILMVMGRDPDVVEEQLGRASLARRVREQVEAEANRRRTDDPGQAPDPFREPPARRRGTERDRPRDPAGSAGVADHPSRSGDRGTK